MSFCPLPLSKLHTHNVLADNSAPRMMTWSTAGKDTLAMGNGTHFSVYFVVALKFIFYEDRKEKDWA